MATQDDVRRIALSFPGAREGKGQFGFSVLDRGKEKGFCWVWLERLHPKKARVPQPRVLAVRTSGLDHKAALIGANPDVYFTEPHYDGFPAILIRLPNITLDELTLILTEGWRCQAPKTTRPPESEDPRRPGSKGAALRRRPPKK